MKKKKTVLWGLALLAVAGIAYGTWPWFPPAFTPGATVADAQAGWPAYGGDEGGRKYSGLAQINRSNVHRLEVAWEFRTGDAKRYADRIGLGAIHATPIKLPDEAGGALVLCSPFARIIAVDPVKGTKRWEFDGAPNGVSDTKRYNCRGVAAWHDAQAAAGAACEWRVFMGTYDRRLLAVDARTGLACADFGANGIVDVGPHIRDSKPQADISAVTFNSPPAVIRDTVVLGATNNGKFRKVTAGTGAARGFDARTGALKWTWDPIPRDPAEAARLGWTPEGIEVTGGGEAWSMMSVDEARDLLFLPTSSPSPDFFGGHRPGNNEYADSLVALRGSTGEVVWHFQIVHHDVWDYDVASQPLLTELERDGVKVPVVVQLTKVGMVFVFERETGKPFYPIEERPVPTDGVPGEQLSPTQPFPVKPAPLVKQSISPDDAWGPAPNFKQQCREKIAASRYGSIYTPPSLEGTTMLPGSSGGMNWGGGAYDPASHILVTPVSQMPFHVRLVPTTNEAEIDDAHPMAGFPFGPPGTLIGSDYALEQRPVMSKIYTPCIAPPWSELVAVDLQTAEIKWRAPLGTIDKLSPVPLPLKWGTPAGGGPIITAGGVAIMAGTADERIRAWDTQTGRELWSASLPTSGMATPMTYEAEGRQYVVVAAGGHLFLYPQKVGDYLVAFALPR